MHARNLVVRTLALALACAVAPAWAAWPKLDPALDQAVAARGRAVPVGAMIEMNHRADALLLDRGADPVVRRRAWITMLTAHAKHSQADLVDQLKAEGAQFQSFWINNTLWVRARPDVLRRVSQRSDVNYVYANTPLVERLPQPERDAGPVTEAVLAIEWGVNKIRAPQVWAAGFRGAGVVVAGQDTGVRWDHAALKAKYRGWNGTTANHNYNWHDSVHSGGIASCPANSTVPCDDHNHGTHTVGTIVGAAGSNQIGVAPDAKWIACRNMNSGAGTPATYTECMQWFLAPTNLAGGSPDPSKAPDIINNSWGCPTSEGCTPKSILQSAVNALVDGGIFFVVSAGNDGSGCGSLVDPPAIYAKSFTIGSTTSTDAMSSFSSRGPVSGAAFNKPDAVAPGSNVRSALKNGSYGSMSGTSMAGPHVAGAAALLISAYPALRGQPEQIADLLRASAVHISSTQVCGGIPATSFPNPVQGDGRIDVYAAYQQAALLFAQDAAGE
ncbi:S8 family serine peptidase [Tahibacter soli]|uniref:S8 family serine peptidase n=1 Tax=Tahibacter soli TaxID=2983605 RepID=A0A9X4BJ97_9GAMM|nr:S8 family serine peptidase [Tahibacter soli]MDC8011939.1 S8 family serine peptidase [Tahibacter soli]